MKPLIKNMIALFRHAGVIAVITLFVKLLGFAEKLLMAQFFGTGMEADSWIVAVSLPMLFLVFIQRACGPAFMPAFMQAYKSNECDGWRLFNSTVNSVLLLSLAVMAVGYVFTTPVVRVFAPGFDADRLGLTVHLTRWILPAGAALGVSAITYLTLNAFKRFAIPALGGVVQKIGLLGAMVLLVGRFGVDALVWGFTIGAVGSLLLHGGGMWRDLKHYRPEIHWRDPNFASMRILMRPLLLGIVVSEICQIVANMIASTQLEGSIAALSYARKIMDLPIILIPLALGTAVFPYFSEMALKEDKKEFNDTFLRTLQFIIFLFLPMSVVLILVREPVVQFIYQRGHFNSASTALTAAPLCYYALGLTTFAIEIPIMQAFFAQKRMTAPIVVGIICVIINIILTLIFIHYIEHSGIALALTCSKTLKVIVLLALFNRKNPTFPWKSLLWYIFRTLAAASLVGASVYAMDLFMIPAPTAPQLKSLLVYLTATAGVSGMSLFAAGKFLGLLNLSQIREMLKSA